MVNWFNILFICRSLWYIAHGFTQHKFKTREYAGTGQCLLKYNTKGVQAVSAISPIKLKQLFVPFMFLFGGYILALLQFIRECLTGRNLLRKGKMHLVRSQQQGAAVLNRIKKFFILVLIKIKTFFILAPIKIRQFFIRFIKKSGVTFRL